MVGSIYSGRGQVSNDKQGVRTCPGRSEACRDGVSRREQCGDLIKSADGQVEVWTLQERSEGAMTLHGQTNTGNFIVEAGDSRYVAASTYATERTRLKNGYEQ